jgi:HNH endonuclease
VRRIMRAHYFRWRKEHGLPLDRCDNPRCIFHAPPLLWNGEPLKPIVDHKNGNGDDNRPKNLRLLCPNCEAQLPTRGGGNKGRVVERTTGGFALRPEGRRAYVMLVEPGHVTVSVKPLKK